MGNLALSATLGLDAFEVEPLELRSNFTEDDIGRRNTITTLLSDWGLLTIVNENQVIKSLNEILISKLIKKISLINFNDL